MHNADFEYFANDIAWDGSFFELALHIGPSSDERLRNVLKSVWSFRGISGCFARSNDNPEKQLRVSPASPPLGAGHQLRGMALLPNGKEVVCGTVAVREVDCDWLCFSIPNGSLSKAYPIFDETKRSEFVEIYDWLASLVRHVSKLTACRLGVIGPGVSWIAHFREPGLGGLQSDPECGYLYWHDGQLVYEPPTFK